ncbi:hypothetical protein MLD38_032596 [Melastoma candidum]|uniref:Uncharacterized protein n=1 Tax=Melastoma candidum TaxID=119954 RepID=A0ACB9M401_9MYRT|nr:hypothetical protein MLD38_032596 [Melastoma candidum]
MEAAAAGQAKAETAATGLTRKVARGADGRCEDAGKLPSDLGASGDGLLLLFCSGDGWGIHGGYCCIWNARGHCCYIWKTLAAVLTANLLADSEARQLIHYFGGMVWLL